jgi:ABC-type branched-subunit amino acid transport system ATPase component
MLSLMRTEPAPYADIVVEVHNLERHFGTFKAVAGISFAVRRGEIFGFLGPNGAGKSTTIRMLCGLLAPTAGSGRVAGFDIVRETERIKTRIGYMSQKFSLYDELTVEEKSDEGRAQGMGAGHGRFARPPPHAHRCALGWLEAAPRPRLRGAPRAADPVSR